MLFSNMLKYDCVKYIYNKIRYKTPVAMLA
jgi:hypothetical protein